MEEFLFRAMEQYWRTDMTQLTAEEIERTISAMNRFEEAAARDPKLVDRFFELLHERPKPHPLTPQERNARLRQRTLKELDNGNGSGSADE